FLFAYSFLLPAMHQAIELLVKAVAVHAVGSFDPRKFSHRGRCIVTEHAADVPIFATIAADARVMTLLQGRGESYVGVRYGDAHVAYDGDAWAIFSRVALALVDDISERTGVPVLPAQLRG